MLYVLIKIEEKFEIGDMQIKPFSIPHDAANPCGFNVFKDNKKIHFISFFTEQGLVDFTILLKNLSDLFIKYCETAGFGEINKTVYCIPKNMIEYQDNYQILISEDNYSHLTPNSI